jgi:hypothetical protein
MPQVGTPGTATSDLSRVQEASRKFDYTYKNSKRFILDIVKDVLCNTSQFGLPDSRVFATVKNGEQVKQLLSLPHADLKAFVLADLNLAGQNANRLVDRNTWLQLSQPIQQYIEGSLQLSQLLGNPQLSQLIAIRGLSTATEIMRQLLEAYDIRSIDKILLPMDNLMGMLGANINGPQNPKSLGPGNSGSQNSIPPSGMGNSPQAS